MEFYDYPIQELNKINEELLRYALVSHKELGDIKEYLYIYQNYYFNKSIKSLNDLINTLNLYKDKLPLMDNRFLIYILKCDLVRLTVPTNNAIRELDVLFDKNCIPFDNLFCDCISTLINALDVYGKKIFNKDLYNCYKKFKRAYSVYQHHKKYIYDKTNVQYMMHVLSRFIVAYTYYYSKDPLIIYDFLLKFINNYDTICDHCYANGMCRNNGQIDMVKYCYYIIKYVNSLDENERKIIK